MKHVLQVYDQTHRGRSSVAPRLGGSCVGILLNVRGQDASGQPRDAGATNVFAVLPHFDYASLQFRISLS